MAMVSLALTPLRALLWRPTSWVALALLVLMTSPLLVILGSLLEPYSPQWQHLRAYLLWDYVLGTFVLWLGVGFITAILGTAMAWITTMLEFAGRRLVEWLVLLPLAIPAYVLAFTYRSIPAFGPLPAVVDWPPLLAVIVVQSLNFYIYVYLFVRASFLQQSVCLLQAGRIAGCGPWTCFFRLALPLARLGVVAGIALALMESMNDFGTMNLFGISTLTTGVYRVWNGFGEITTAAQLAAMVVLFVFCLLAIERFVRSRASYHHRRERQKILSRYRLSKTQTSFVWGAVVVMVALTTVWPLLRLIGWAMEAEGYAWQSALFEPLLHSVILAAAAVGLVLTICLWLTYAQRLRPQFWQGPLIRLSSIGYAIPGVVLALGIFIVLQHSQDAVAPYLSTEAIWASSIAAVLLAYVIRFVNFGFSSIEVAFAKISRSLDEAAGIAGASAWRIIGHVHWPLLRRPLFAGAILIFVEVIKELPATLLLRPFNFDTLAIRAYQLAADERLAEAAIPALTMVAAGLVAVVVFSRMLAEPITQTEGEP